MRTKHPARGHRGLRAGYTLVEVAVSTLIVSVLLVAAMNTAGYATRGQIDNKQRAQAKLIANAMLAEILELPYQEPSGTPGFGPESGEVRATYDDVDDYKLFTESPPVDKQGAALAGGTGLTHSVVVNYAEPDNLTATSSTDKGVKRIMVSVARGGTELVSITTVVVK
ncbi:MAG: type II secretion system protein [Planctomycetota bacterium]